MKKSIPSMLLVASTVIFNASIASAAAKIRPNPQGESMMCDYSNNGDDQEYCCTRKAKDAELCYSVTTRGLPQMQLLGCRDDDAAKLIFLLQGVDSSPVDSITATCTR